MEYIFSFQGRSTRKNWWIIAVISYFLVLVVAFIWGLSAYRSGIDPDHYIGNDYALIWAGFKSASTKVQTTIILLSSFIIWIWSASNVKRYHDLGKSGYWALTFLVPVIGPFWNIIECGFLAGACGENRYDHSNDDKAKSSDEDEFYEEAESEKSALGRHNFAAEDMSPKPMFGA